MTQVRAAQAEDRTGILLLCKELHSENGQHTIHWPNVEMTVDRCLDRNRGAIGLIGPVSEPVGMIMMYLDQIWYSNEFQLLEVLNFVHPEHRKTDYAKSLIQYGKDMSEELGIDFMIGILSHKRMEAKCRLYQRQIPKMGEFFLYVPQSKTAGAAIAAE